jgi:hypothetical protein
MAYIKNTWVDREGVTRYFETVDEDGALILTPDYAQVTEIGTPVNADNMNHIEEGIVDHEERITILEDGQDTSQYLNKSQITNCILEAPNDYLTVSGNTITVKAGLKYLSANGRNTDGTLKNIETVLSGDASVTLDTTTTSDRYLLGNSAGSIIFWWDKAVFIQEDEPDVSSVIQYSSGLWHRPSTNIWYAIPKNSTAPYNWTPTEHPACILAHIGRNKTTSIKTVERRQPFRAVDYNDKAEITGWAMPSNKYIDLTLGASGSTYTAPANGYVTISKRPTAANQYCYLENQTADFSFGGYATVSGYDTNIFLPVSKGDIFAVNYNMAGQTTYFKFIYAKGDK